MARDCTVCSHADRVKIDEALAAERSHRSIARQYAVSRFALDRHSVNHLGRSLLKLQARRAERGPERVLDRVGRLADRLEERLDALDREGAALGPALAVIRELRAALELVAKLSGELRPETAVQIVNVMQNPSMQAALSIVLDELADEPELRARIAARLQQLELPA